MLAGLMDYAQDDRYRTVVNDLLSRYLERAEVAIEDGNIGEAQNWLEALKEDPFRILGRRTEVYRLENAIRGRRTRSRFMMGGFFIILLILLGLGAVFTQPVWGPALFPTQTPTQTPTLTPSITATPSNTPTASNTPTPSDTSTASATFTPSSTPTWTTTPTWTWTPSPTITPSYTPTASLTPTHTITPTHTHTPSLTPTTTQTPSLTPVPSATSTPPSLCRVVVLQEIGSRLRTRPTTSATVLTLIRPGTSMDVLRQEYQEGLDNGPIWFFVRLNLDDSDLTGWVRADTVSQFTECPPLP